MNNMKVELSLREMNELVYALGIADSLGRLSDKETNNQLGEKLRDAIDEILKSENLPTNKEMDEMVKEIKWREYVEQKCEEDAMYRELNNKWHMASWIKHCKDSWKKDIK